MCVIFIKCLICIEIPINYALGRLNLKNFNERMLPHVPIKHVRGQITFFFFFLLFFFKSHHFCVLL